VAKIAVLDPIMQRLRASSSSLIQAPDDITQKVYVPLEFRNGNAGYFKIFAAEKKKVSSLDRNDQNYA